MRYEDARFLRETERLSLRARLLWVRAMPKARGRPYGRLEALSDHELRDIGLTRLEAQTGRRGRPLL